jgi:hypothetical protein
MPWEKATVPDRITSAGDGVDSMADTHESRIFKKLGLHYGEAKRAARLWGAAQALHEDKVIPRDPDFLAEADARISVVRSGVGEEGWEEAWREGRAMTLDEAVSYALAGEEEARG